MIRAPSELVLLTLVFALPAPAFAQTADPGYRVGVVSESGDIATWLKPIATGLSVERVVPVGIMPSDIDGPHNITVAPDGKSYYITIAHGTPFGSLWKMDAAGDSLLGRAQVELFPTTVSVTPDGQFAFVANSDFHGDHPRVNVISVIHTPTMTRITDIPACDMPHGVKVNHAGPGRRTIRRQMDRPRRQTRARRAAGSDDHPEHDRRQGVGFDCHPGRRPIADRLGNGERRCDRLQAENAVSGSDRDVRLPR